MDTQEYVKEKTVTFPLKFTMQLALTQVEILLYVEDRAIAIFGKEMIAMFFKKTMDGYSFQNCTNKIEMEVRPFQLKEE